MTLTRRLLLLGSSCTRPDRKLCRARPSRKASNPARHLRSGQRHLPDERAAGAGRPAARRIARLAAVVKAERAKGGNVMFVHAGDTLSPSLMSGIDRGEHIMTLTNMIAPDIFVPGNHEFDFGKELFFKRMARGEIPALLREYSHTPDGKLTPGLRERNILDIQRHPHRDRGRNRRGSRDPVQPGRPEISALRSTSIEKQAARLRKEGADVVVAVVHTGPRQGRGDVSAMRAADIILSGHDHDLWINYDDRTAAAESSHDAHFVTCIDITFTVRTNEGRREVIWHPEFRLIDTRNVAPDAEIAAVVERYENEAFEALDIADRDHRGRTRQPQSHRAHAGSRDRRPDRGCHARGDQCRHRHHQWRRHPRRPNLSARHHHHAPRHHGGIAVPQYTSRCSRFRAARSARASKTASAPCRGRPDASRRCPG